MGGTIPDALRNKVAKFKGMTTFDVMDRLEQLCTNLSGSDQNPPEAYNFVCPICESFMFYLIVDIPGQNKPHTVSCQHCKSKSGKRTVECAKIELLFSLKHRG
jgi:hypothetical protein